MKILIVSWHPEPASFNTSMFRVACETLPLHGHDIQLSNLLEMCFDPVSDRHNFSTVKDPLYFKQQIEEMHATENNGFATDIEAELAKLEWCELMIWQFPLWWFGLPAVLKGWVDRIFVMGRVYGGGRIYETGVFRGKKALLSLTTGGPLESYRKDGFNGDIMAILKPIHRGMLQFVGFDVLAPYIVYGPARMSDAERGEELARYGRRLAGIGAEEAIDVGRY
jgi:NAD(P)H dehydrogenase (quinone)